MWRIRYILLVTERLRRLPALARDLSAVLAVLAAFAAAAALPTVDVPAAALVLVPTLLVAALAFGRDSALLAALFAALAARHLPYGPEDGPVGLLPILVLSAMALVLAAFLEELRRSRTEAESAHLRSDTTARRAAERVEMARRQLRDAEARLYEGERKARSAAAVPPRTSSRDPSLETAFSSEGGI